MARSFALLILAAACTTEVPAPPADVEEAAPPKLPACAQTGTLHAVSLSGDLEDLTADAKLAVTLGFQGFQFTQVVLRSPIPLLSPTRLTVGVDVPGKMTYSVSHGGVQTYAQGNQWQTGPELVFFNDAPLVELLGQPAAITLKASTGTCLVAASAEVELTDGGFADADASIWGDASN